MTEKKLNEELNDDQEDSSLNIDEKELKEHPLLFRIFILIYKGIASFFNGLVTLVHMSFSFMSKHWIASLTTVFIIIPILFTVLYIIVENTSFPETENKIISAAEEVQSKGEIEKGTVLSKAIYNQLDRELNSFFGWSVNDLIITPTAWLDNRSHRQEGVIFATMLFERFFSTQVAKYGTGEGENDHLKKARTTYFVFQPDKFWLPASESQYKKGINMMKMYEKELAAGDATYNLRTDDLYALFKLLISENFLGEPLGRLNSDEYRSYFKCDDAVYYTQGVVIVVRDVVQTLYILYPEILKKGSDDNFIKAFKMMDDLASFDPLLVVNGTHDSMLVDHRAKTSTYLFNLIERLRDIANSINR